MHNVRVSSVLGSFVVAGVVACSGDAGAPAEPALDADGGAPVPSDVPPVAGGCDTTQLPSQSKCVLHETLGVFVAPRGNDGNDGSRARPFATLARAIEAAKASARRVYVCAGTYSEKTVVLSSGVSIFGNLDCSAPEWSVSSARAVITAIESPAARAKDIVAETRIEGVELVAPAAIAPGASSIGLIAENAAGLRFVAGRIAASAAAAGVDGAAAAQMPETPSSFDGEASAVPGGCTAKGDGYFTCPAAHRAVGGTGQCVAGDVRLPANAGGEGGEGAVHLYDALTQSMERVKMPHCIAIFGGEPICYWSNERGYPSTATSATNVGWATTYSDAQYAIEPASSAPALAGQPGAAGEDGVNGAFGTLTAQGYAPSDGSAGTHGAPGQGGGGGAARAPVGGEGAPSRYRTGYGGSGGGAGGCPGLAGGAGTGGGASIAVLASASAMRFEAFALEAGAGGKGGRGSLGSLARAGGKGGSAPAGGVTQGAAGGAGGRAGVSGHGGSGPSFALAWTGVLPSLSADSSTAVAAPQAGPPAEGRIDASLSAGAPGLSEAIHAF